MSKLRARMQFLRDNIQPALSRSENRGAGLLSIQKRDAIEPTADPELRERLQSNSQASSSQATMQALSTGGPAHRPAALLDTSRNSGSNWDRRFRHSCTVPVPTCSAQAAAPPPPVHHIQPAAQQTDTLQQGASHIAEVK